MRRLLLSGLAFLVALGAATPAEAQRWVGALKAGGAITNFSGETRTDVTFDPRVGLAGGGALGYDFGTGFAILPELLYVRKGAYFDTLLGEIPTRIRSDLAYLEVPVLAQYRFETNGYVHPKVFAGPMVAFLLDSRIEIRALGSDLTQNESDDSIESRDFGAVVGAGVEVEVGDQRLSFDARASLGMADITRPSDDPGLSNPSLHNRGIEFFIGIVF
jgi:opacity protein-like surface antigen